MENDDLLSGQDLDALDELTLADYKTYSPPSPAVQCRFCPEEFPSLAAREEHESAAHTLHLGRR